VDHAGQQEGDLRHAWQLACEADIFAECTDGQPPSSIDIVNEFSAHFVASGPVWLISDGLQIDATEFVFGGDSSKNVVKDSVATLYGNGYLEVRLLVLGSAPANWTLEVESRHDDPPPVELTITVDTDTVGLLRYDKGDNSWETKSLEIPLMPGYHSLGLWYLNDHFDTVNKIDRNAYIQNIRWVE
jgi:hypothetical protein